MFVSKSNKIAHSQMPTASKPKARQYNFQRYVFSLEIPSQKIDIFTIKKYICVEFCSIKKNFYLARLKQHF